MINREITDQILTIGPAPDMKGGIAQVLDTYFSEVFDRPKFIAETVDGPQVKRVAASITALFKLIGKLLTDNKIKIVHLHTATKVSFPRTAIYAKVARLLGRKTITHVHGSNFDDYYRRHKHRVTKALKGTTQVVALSDSWKQFFEQEVGLGNVKTIPNIITTPSTISEKDTADGVTHALFLGLLGERKGIFDLLEALSSIHGSLRGRFMLHVGGNGEVDKFKKTVKSLGLDDIVTFHGWVKAADKEALLNKSSIFILPSFGEGLPISILEAMAFSNAIISTPVGGIPEVVDRSNGILITPGDKKAIAEAITALIDNPEQIKAMGKASVAKVEKHRRESVENELEKMYTEILDRQ